MTTTIPRHHGKRGSKMYSTKKKEEEEKKKKSGTSSKTRKDQKGHGDEADGQKLRGGQKGHKGIGPVSQNLPRLRITRRIPVPNAALAIFR